MVLVFSEKGSGLYVWFSKQPVEVLPCLHKNVIEYHQTYPLCSPAAFCSPSLNWKGTWCYDRMLHRMARSFVLTLHVCLCPSRWDDCRLLSNWTGQRLWRRLHQDHSCPVALWNVLHSERKQDLDQVRTWELIHNHGILDVATRGQLHTT